MLYKWPIRLGVKRTNPIGTLGMYNGPIKWVHDACKKDLSYWGHNACTKNQSLWVHDACTKDQSYGYTMHVKRTNLMRTQCMHKGTILWLHNACTKDQSYGCTKEQSYGYTMHIMYKGPILCMYQGRILLDMMHEQRINTMGT